LFWGTLIIIGVVVVIIMITCKYKSICPLCGKPVDALGRDTGCNGTVLYHMECAGDYTGDLEEIKDIDGFYGFN
jgi:hypothetical protein